MGEARNLTGDEQPRARIGAVADQCCSKGAAGDAVPDLRRDAGFAATKVSTMTSFGGVDHFSIGR